MLKEDGLVSAKDKHTLWVRNTFCDASLLLYSATFSNAVTTFNKKKQLKFREKYYISLKTHWQVHHNALWHFSLWHWISPEKALVS